MLEAIFVKILQIKKNTLSIKRDIKYDIDIKEKVTFIK